MNHVLAGWRSLAKNFQEFLGWFIRDIYIYRDMPNVNLNPKSGFACVLGRHFRSSMVSNCSVPHT